MKPILWILPVSLALAAVACSKGEPAPRTTYTAGGNTGPRYSAPRQRQGIDRTVSVARAGTPAAAPMRTAPPVRYDPYVPPVTRVAAQPSMAPVAPMAPKAPMARTYPTPPPMVPTPQFPPQSPPQSPPQAHASFLPTGGSFRWASSLSEAQDAARASGRMLFIETGRPSCGNCQALRNEVIPDPAVSAELGAMVVGYYVDCDREPGSKAYTLLVSNLPGAAVLPLVGFFTSDLRWVHGYSGGRNVSRFRQEMSTARAAYQRIAVVDRPASPFETASLGAQSLGSLPDEELADVSRELSDDRMLDASSAIADAPSERTLAVAPTAPVAVEPVAAAPVLAEVASAAAAAEQAATARAETALAAARDAERAALEAERALAAERAEAERVAAEDRAREALAAALAAEPEMKGTAVVSPRAAPALVVPMAPAAEPAGAVSGDGDVRAWAQTELLRAAAALAKRDYASARAILAFVRTKAAGAPEAREAAKGDVAIWNLRKIERAGATDDAGRLRTRAKADLEATVFEALFA